MTINRRIIVFGLWLTGAVGCMAVGDNNKYLENGEPRDSLELNTVVVMGKSRVQQLKEGAFSLNAVDIHSQVNSLTTLADAISRTAGINIRTEGGLGSDYSLSVNGMTGNSIRYYVDGVPMTLRGNSVNLSNFPVNTIDHVEIYKGVVPAFLGGDALGGAINIVTRKEHKSFVDASVSVGSFHTYRADVNSQVVLNKKGLLLRPQFTVDYTKNDYKVHGVEVWNAGVGRYDTVSRKRFHDRYFSTQAQVDMGVEHKSWADQFFVGLGYSVSQKQLQTGTVQTIVYGKAERNSDALNVHATYRKRGFLTDKLTTLLSLSHTWDHSVTIDTTFHRYTWDGTSRLATKNETNGRGKQYRHYKRPLTIGRANFCYEFNDQHSLSLNYMYNRTGNKRYDTAEDYCAKEDVDATFTPSDDCIEKQIIGLNYDQSLLDDRLVSAFFVKDYINHVRTEQNDLYWLTHSNDVERSATKTYWGYGMAVRFNVYEWFSPKFSYEHAVRLPQAREQLGNGTTTYANLALRPETSHNMNLGLYGNVKLAQEQSLYYELNGFLRFTQDYIHLRISDSDGTAQYENVNDVDTHGLEGEVRYSYSNWLQVSANACWQDSKDMNKYLDNGNRSATYRNRIPNKPWFFGNAELTLSRHNLLHASDCLRFSYDYQYVHWFYLTWESYGYLPSKARIPTQNMHNASLTYSWKNERYNLTFMCNNLFDATMYDDYKLQKPGRSFTAKFRVYIR
ncbi:MAG: TonB-dependent receptor plug domain-containing protein [Bacteroidaceae bacterium]|nr:TonB-dependent receptor plug domain-containing protein [Bacteroidaceae bacterium]